MLASRGPRLVSRSRRLPLPGPRGGWHRAGRVAGCTRQGGRSGRGESARDPAPPAARLAVSPWTAGTRRDVRAPTCARGRRGGRVVALWERSETSAPDRDRQAGKQTRVSEVVEAPASAP